MSDPRTFPTANELLRHAGWLRRLAERLVGEGAADDLVQETWLSALLHRPQNPGPWLRRVLHNRAATDARARSRQRAREVAHAQPEPLLSTGDLAARAETTRVLVEAVLRLTSAQRDVILLRYFDELPPAVIAKRLGMPSATVRSHLARGLARLRQDLDAAAGGDRARWMHALAPLTMTTATTTAHASPLLAALLMTNANKIFAGLFFLALIGLGAVSWQLILEPSEPPTLTVGMTEDLAGDSSRDSHGPSNEEEPAHRTVFLPSPNTSRVNTLLVQVVDGVTGKAVPGATVRFLNAESDWQDLTWEAKVELGWNRERFLKRGGLHTETDKDGYALVPQRHSFNVVTARKGSLFGTGARAMNASTIHVTVFPEKLLFVEVRYADGRPAPGVRVNYRRSPAVKGRLSAPALKAQSLLAKITFSGPWTGDTLLGITDADGLVRFHLEGTEGLPAMTLYVCMTGYKHGEQTVDLTTIRDQPVRFTLPPCGSFTVRLLDAEGQILAPHALPEPFATILTYDANVHKTGYLFDSMLGQRAQVNAEGVVRFQHVPLGQIVMLSLHGIRDPLNFLGPTIQNPDVVVEHRLGQGLPALLGTLVGPDGELLREARLTLAYYLGSGMIRTPIRTDKNGAFHAFVPAQVASAKVSVSAHYAHLAGEIPLRGPISGSTGVGIVVMQRPPLLVAGRVERSDGQRVVRASVALEYRKGSNWRRVTNVHPKSLGDGRFEFFGIVPDAELRLAVYTENFARIAPIAFVPGTRDVSIVLRPGGTLRTTLVVTPGLDWRKLRYELWRIDGEHPGDRTTSLRVKTASRLRGRGVRVRLAFRGLAAGTYRLLIRKPKSTEPLVEIQHVAVRAGEDTDDPRLRDIPVRGK